MAFLRTHVGGCLSRRRRWVVLAGLALAAGWLSLRCGAETVIDLFAGETTELAVKSDFSQIVVTRKGDVRSLWFVHDTGPDGLESQQDLRRPYRLLLPYSQYMFAGYLVQPKQERVLLVGLGGGSMVQFLKHYEPETQVDVVEIDPAIVKIADEYFGVRSEGKVKITVDDAFKYLKATDARYDAIYMDAFLKPSDETDTSGVPLKLKTVQFLKDVQTKLKSGGLMVFNVHVYDDTEETLETIRAAFPQVYVFTVSHGWSLAVVGSTATERVTEAELQRRAKETETRWKADFSLLDVLEGLRPEPAAEKPKEAAAKG